jgi:heme exporter protein D
VSASPTSLLALDESTSFQWQLVLLCWFVVLGAIAVLVVRSVQRGRRLSQQVPEEKRRWM